MKSAFLTGRLPQAFLFSGEESLGKKKVAFEFVKLLFCEHQDVSKKPCQKCLACLLVEKNQHPDFIFVVPETKSTLIDQIRNLQEMLRLKPSLSGLKAVVINDAHCLNVQAQNCFLKTLEEPQGKTIFILISSFSHQLLPTIRSRCETLKFYPVPDSELEGAELPEGAKLLPNSKELSSFRAFTQGKPGLAIHYIRNPQLVALQAKAQEQVKVLFKKDVVDRLLFAKEFFEKNKENVFNETSFFLENMTLVLRATLRRKLNEGSNANRIGIFQRIKKAIELTQEAQYLLQTTNVNARLLLENLVLQI